MQLFGEEDGDLGEAEGHAALGPFLVGGGHGQRCQGGERAAAEDEILEGGQLGSEAVGKFEIAERRFLFVVVVGVSIFGWLGHGVRLVQKDGGGDGTQRLLRRPESPEDHLAFPATAGGIETKGRGHPSQCRKRHGGPLFRTFHQMSVLHQSRSGPPAHGTRHDRGIVPLRRHRRPRHAFPPLRQRVRPDRVRRRQRLPSLRAGGGNDHPHLGAVGDGILMDLLVVFGRAVDAMKVDIGG
mmetsp:Transcript_24049/g.50999  ORF Transcript_24049/g.50999 Transcript_24049/m.50999 type:complete len:240 (-) Transcript_24049:1571-2290(-)